MRLTTAHEGEGTCRGEHSRRAFGQVPSTLVVFNRHDWKRRDLRSKVSSTRLLSAGAHSFAADGAWVQTHSWRLDISSSFQRLALKREEICLRLKRLRQVTATHHLSTNYSLRWIVAVRDHRKGKRTDCWRLNAKQSFIFSFPVVSVPSALMAPIGTSPPLFLGQLLARKRVETQKQLFPTNNSLGNSVSGWRCSGIWRILFPLAPDPSTSRKENSSDESSPLTRRNMRYETTHQEFSFPSDANSQPPKNSYGGGWLVSDGHMTAFTRTIVAVMWEEVLIDRFLFPVDQ